MSEELLAQWRSVARTHVGKVRKLNEDTFVNCPEKGLFAVADGMGGLSRGDLASGLVKERLEQLALPDDLQESVDRVEETLADVNARLRSEAEAGRMGCTIVAMIVRGDRFACIWAGDSRLYRSAGGELDRLSRDHSLVEELVSSGAITEEAARTHPLSNRITRAVGTEPRLRPEVIDGLIRKGDRMLLSSDGLHGFVERGGIADLASKGTLEEAADALIDAALEGGGRDNITVVLVERPE